MKPLVIIPARGGSKGLPGKNIKILNGKPLLHYTIEIARTLFKDECICLSTDDLNIKLCAESIGLAVPFLRPDELARDNSTTHDVLLHAIEFYRERGYEADTVVLLQPTSPFRTANQLQEAVSLFNQKIDMIVSVKESKANPFILFEEGEKGWLTSIAKGDLVRRQDFPKVWQYNGAIYVINISTLMEKSISKFEKIKKFVMDDPSSLDIDTEFDWMIAEAIAKSKTEHQF